MSKRIFQVSSFTPAQQADGVLAGGSYAGIKPGSVAAGTKPNRSPAVSIARLNLSFNAFGGIIQWQTNPGSEEEWVAVGNATTSNSETVLSSQNVGTAGLIGADWFYEVL
jgi:hypothetical protein